MYDAFQSLEVMLTERVEVYKQKEQDRLKEEREVHHTHKQMTSELKRAMLDKHKKFLQDQSYINIQKQDHTVCTIHNIYIHTCIRLLLLCLVLIQLLFINIVFKTSRVV